MADTLNDQLQALMSDDAFYKVDFSALNNSGVEVALSWGSTSAPTH